jgi:hypothetical protein
MQPDRVADQPADGAGLKSAPKSTSTTTAGVDQFAASVDAQSGWPDRALLERHIAWANSLAQAGLARLYNSVGKGRWTLQVRVPGYDAGLITLWSDKGAAYVTAFRSVFERWFVRQSRLGHVRLLATEPDVAGCGLPRGWILNLEDVASRR